MAFREHVRRHYVSASSASPKPHSLHCLHYIACTMPAIGGITNFTRVGVG